jgi:Fe-S cluster assembly ATP-binding protein
MTVVTKAAMATQPLLSVTNLSVSIDEKLILKNFSVQVAAGTVHALMGPNGSGKSTLSLALLGHPAYEVSEGTITFDGVELNELSPDKRAKLGIFLAFQYPFEIEGLPLRDFLRQAYNAWYGGTEKQIGIRAFNKLLEEKMALLGIDPLFADRHLNVGFSGGEKKRAEMLQLAVLQPRLVILDEIDSGLDVDALRSVGECLRVLRAENPSMAVLLITHYQRMLQHITPDTVHIMQKGAITQSGGPTLAEEVEAKGYK